MKNKLPSVLTARLRLIVAGLLILALNFIFLAGASAQTYLTASTIATTNMVNSGNAALAVAFTTSSAGSTAKFVEIVFPSGYTVAATQSVTNNCNSTNFGNGLSGA